MSKNIINGVLVLMSISLLGVVGLQLYWINDAIQVKQAEFDRSVNEALTRVVAKLETQEAAGVVANQMATLQNDSLKTKAPEQTTATNTNSAKTSQKQKPVSKQPEKPLAEAQTLEQPSPKRYHRYKFTNSDSVQISIALQASAEDNGMAHFQRVFQAKGEPLEAAFIRKGDAQQGEKAQDSIKLLRLYNRPVKISVDTLRTVALRLDSLMKKNKVLQNTSPFEIASVDIRNDSIFILKKKSGDKPVPARVQYVLKPGEQPQEISDKKFIYRNLAHAKALSGRHNVYFRQKQDSTSATKKGIQPSKLPISKPTLSDISKIELKKDKLNDVVQKMVVEYVVKDEPLQKRLNLEALPNLLQAELENKGINLDFGYWVVSGKSDTVAVHNVAALTPDRQPMYKASLFPNDIFDKPDHLGLYFADSRAYAMKSLWGMMSLSALFTLVMIATFGTTIHIIYKQKKLSEMKNDFINNMTHEFKTPIATISLATDAIANPKIYEHPEKIKHYTGIIRQENKRMNAQVENVLQIAQLEKNDFKMNFKPVDVHILAAKAIESIRLQVEERLGQIHMQLNARHHELRLDEVHLFNVICNLLDNANKYSPASPEIKLETQNLDGGLLIAVEDKGMGMSKETQQRVFDKFYRVPTGNLHNVKGFGLGLSYVKAIVQAHKGNVRLKSEPGKGSRFEIFLPLG